MTQGNKTVERAEVIAFLENAFRNILLPGSLDDADITDIAGGLQQFEARRAKAHTPEPATELVEALERLRPLSERATWGPWCWEQCGDKCDAPVVGIAMPADDENGERCYAGRLTDEDAYRYGRIAVEWHDCDGHSAAANADFAVAAVNFVRQALATLSQDQQS